MSPTNNNDVPVVRNFNSLYERIEKLSQEKNPQATLMESRRLAKDTSLALDFFRDDKTQMATLVGLMTDRIVKAIQNTPRDIRSLKKTTLNFLTVDIFLNALVQEDVQLAAQFPLLAIDHVMSVLQTERVSQPLSCLPGFQSAVNPEIYSALRNSCTPLSKIAEGTGHAAANRATIMRSYYSKLSSLIHENNLTEILAQNLEQIASHSPFLRQ